MEDEEYTTLATHLRHRADIVLVVEGLSSGYCKDVHGQVSGWAYIIIWFLFCCVICFCIYVFIYLGICDIALAKILNSLTLYIDQNCLKQTYSRFSLRIEVCPLLRIMAIEL